MEPTIKILSAKQFLITFWKLNGSLRHWIVTNHEKNGVHIMETTGNIVDDSMYSFETFDGEQKHGTLYDFYYHSKYEFKGYLMSISGERVYMNFRDGDVFKSWYFAPDNPDGYAFWGKNTYEYSVENHLDINSMLDWYHSPHGYVMYDNRLEMTRSFRERTSSRHLDDICHIDIPIHILGELKTMARLLPKNVLELLPESERPYYKQILDLAIKTFGINLILKY